MELFFPEPSVTWSLSSDKPPQDFLEQSLLRHTENPAENLKPVDLKVDQLSVKATGFYKCVSVNEHGTSELGVWIVGAQPTEPGLDFQNETTISGRAGDSLELGCEVIVDPVLTEAGPVRRFWEKDGKIMVKKYKIKRLWESQIVLKFH